MKTPLYLAAAFCLLFQIPVRAEFVILWELGADDNNQADFSQESGINEPPGQVSLPDEVPEGSENDGAFILSSKDDDYYFAGTYPDPIGEVEQDEPWKAFERAVTTWDMNSRIHFILNAEQVVPTNRLRFTIDTFWPGAVSGPSVHDLQILMNGVEIRHQIGIAADMLIEITVSAGAVEAVEGENILEIVRTGGSADSWIQFDYLRAEVDTDVCPNPVCDFSASATTVDPGQEVTLSWIASPESTLVLNPGAVNLNQHGANGLGSLKLAPDGTTTYILSATKDGVTENREITITVPVILSFQSNRVSLSANEAATLFWRVDPSATVTIDQGIGAVNGETDEFGRGYRHVTPGNQSRTYTLTAVKGSRTESATVELSYAEEFAVLWQLGLDDNSQADFVQEVGAVPAPGSPLYLDNDYYFPGFYDELFEDPIVYAAENPATNFGRAVTSIATSSRIHFHVTEPAPPPASRLRVSVDLIWGGWWNVPAQTDGTDFGVHDIEIFVNGNSVWAESEITADRLLQAEFTAGEVSLIAGENIVEILRTGGDSGGDPSNISWIQFDYLLVEIDTRTATPPAAAPVVTAVSREAATGALTLTWTSQAGQAFRVEASTDLAAWPAPPLVTGHPATGTSTSFTHQPAEGVTTLFYRVVRE